MKFTSILAAIAICIAAISCTKEETEDQICGEYEGMQSTTLVKGMGDPEQKVYTIKDYKDGKCTLQMPFNHPFDMTDVEVKDLGNGKFSLHHGPFTESIYINKNGLDGTIENGVLTLKFNVIIAPMAEKFPKGMDYNFSGKRK